MNFKKTATVRFIGDQSYYRLSCDKFEYKYCRDCECKSCDSLSFSYSLINGKLYNAYFLEYWQGERTGLHVKCENGEIDDYFNINDFEIISDPDGILNYNEATVRCITHRYEETGCLEFGKTYKALGFNKKGNYLVMDNSSDCYFYSSSSFEIIKDENGVLDKTVSSPIYQWDKSHKDSI